MFVFGKELGELCTDFTVNSFKTFVKNVMDVIKTIRVRVSFAPVTRRA